MLTELGWPMQPLEVFRRWVGKSSADQLAEITERLGAEAAAEFDERSTAEVDRAFQRSLSPVDGALPLLDHLDDIDLPYCLASSSSHARLRSSLGIVGLRDRFADEDLQRGGRDRGKPAPDLFLYAAQQMGFEPARCAVVEDSVYGVQAALAAGMTAFGYAGGLTDARSLSAAGATVVHEMSDLVGLLIHSSASSA